jgi:hypothetical protein
MTRRCGICHQTGHNRRNCPNHQPVMENVQSNHIRRSNCMLCGGAHDPYNCPILQDEPQGEYFYMENVENVQNDNYQDVIGDFSNMNQVVPPPPPPSPPSQISKINWDKCSQCGKPNQGKTCSCGAKMITEVPCNSQGFYECTICYNDLKDLNKVTTKCGHHFCIDCFVSHYNSNQAMSTKCPMCRAELLEQQQQRAPEQHHQPRGIIRYIARYIHNF